MRLPTSGAFYLTLGVVVFGAGAAALQLRGPARIPVENGVVSRAPDAQVAVEPAIAGAQDGHVAVTWMALPGGRDGARAAYLGLRTSADSGKTWSDMRRVRSPGDRAAADPSLVAVKGGGFVLVWLGVPGAGGTDPKGELDAGGEQVYLARIDPGGGVGAPEPLATPGRTYEHPCAVALPDGRVAVAYAFAGSQGSGVEIATVAQAQAPTRKVLATKAAADYPGLCADASGAVMLVFRDATRGIVAAPDALGAAKPLEAAASLPAERVARGRPQCWVSGHEAWVTYATGDVTSPKETTSLVDTLEVARSIDGGRAFRKRAGFRPGPRMMLPTVLRDDGGFLLVAVTGSGRNDAHAQVSAIHLAADGSSQKGLTETVLSPVEMVVRAAQPGFMGDYVGVARVGKSALAALVDNHEGPPRVTVVPVPR